MLDYTSIMMPYQGGQLKWSNFSIEKAVIFTHTHSRATTLWEEQILKNLIIRTPYKDHGNEETSESS